MGSKLKLEDQGHPTNYVGVNIKKQVDGSYEFTLPALTMKIIEDVCLGPRTTPKPIPCVLRDFFIITLIPLRTTRASSSTNP